MLQLRTNKILIPRIARALEKYLYSFRDFQKSLNIKEWDEVYMVIQLIVHWLDQMILNDQS